MKVSFVVVCLALVSFAAVLTTVAAVEDDYYKLLGLQRDATQPEIKRAFRRISMKFISFSVLPSRSFFALLVHVCCVREQGAS